MTLYGLMDPYDLYLLHRVQTCISEWLLSAAIRPCDSSIDEMSRSNWRPGCRAPCCETPCLFYAPSLMPSPHSHFGIPLGDSFSDKKSQLLPCNVLHHLSRPWRSFRWHTALFMQTAPPMNLNIQQHFAWMCCCCLSCSKMSTN